MRVLAAVLIAGCFIFTPAHAFEFDKPFAETMRQFGQTLVADLVVGDTGIVSFSAFCSKDGKLHVLASTPLENPGGWRPFTVTREAGGTVRAVMGRDAAETWSGLVNNASRSCQSILSQHSRGDEVIPVSTVNGHSSISEAMKD